MRNTITSPRVIDMKRKLRAYRIRLTILLFILFLSIVGALAYFSSYPRIVIKKVIVTGTQIINPSDIESTVKEDLLGRYFYLFTRADSLIYPYNKIYRDLIIKFPRIEKLYVYRDNLNTLHIDLTERSGSYLYCGENVPELPTEIGEDCYFINSDGYVFDKAPYFSGNVYFKYYMPIPDSSYDSALSTQILPPERFHILAQFIEGVASLGFKPNYVIIDKDGGANLYLNHDDFDTSPKIIFKNNDQTLTMLDNLKSSMGKSEFANEINSKYTTLLYIDLRFNNKVVYKFQ